MATCRSISAQLWAEAFENLVFYFSRRLQRSDAEDLAQQTLMQILDREDFQFREEDFKLVVYGFARNILRTEKRRLAKWKTTTLDDGAQEIRRADGKAAENAVYLQEVLNAGRKQLSPDEWRLVTETAEAYLDNTQYNFPPNKANRLRVALHRARRKLARFTEPRA